METFAKRFKRALEIKGKTQSQISTYAEVDQAAVSNYVAGRYSPRPETAKRIAEYLGVSEAWLMGYDVPMDPESKADPLTEQALQVALFGGEEEVTPEMWDEVKRFAEFVKTKHKDKN
jgi:transcriptional regulator with XRE-family HTH domain